MKPLVFANFLAPNMTQVYADIAALVGRALGRPTELIDGSALEQLRDGPVDVAFLCGLPYVRLCRERTGTLRPLAAPVLDEPRCEDRPVYFSDVIVQQDSPLRWFGDLRGDAGPTTTRTPSPVACWSAITCYRWAKARPSSAG